jgi:hypothetical protein
MLLKVGSTCLNRFIFETYYVNAPCFGLRKCLGFLVQFANITSHPVILFMGYHTESKCFF